MMPRVLALILALGIGAAGCSGDGAATSSLETTTTVAERFAGLQEKVDEGRALWESHRIDDYAFTYSAGCFGCPSGPVEILVRDGAVADAVEDGRPPQRTWRTTFDSLFDMLDRAIEDEYDVLSFSLDPEYGYPTRAELDKYAWVDEEFRFGVKEFTVPGTEPQLSAEHQAEVDRLSELRTPDRFGRIRGHEMHRGYEVLSLGNNAWSIGAVTIERLNGEKIDLPAGTPLFGPMCRRLQPDEMIEAGEPPGERPCFLNIGLNENGTAAWVEVIPASGPGEPFVTGTPVEAIGEWLLLDTGTVIRGSRDIDATARCGGGDVTFHLHPRSGNVLRTECARG